MLPRGFRPVTALAAGTVIVVSGLGAAWPFPAAARFASPTTIGPALASASSPTPVDVDGTYALTGAAGQCQGTQLTLSGGIWWTGQTDLGDFSATLSDPSGSATGVGSEGTNGMIALNFPSLYLTFGFSEKGSTVTLTETQLKCTGVTTSAESLSNLPTITGTQTKADGTLYGGGVSIEGNIAGVPNGWCCMADQFPQGAYKFWVQPGTYTVGEPYPYEVNGQPVPWVSQCIGGHKTGPAQCTFAFPASKSANSGRANFVVQQPTGIGGSVDDTDGSAMAGVQVNLTGTDSTTGEPVDEQTLTESDGSYSFTLNAGTYSVRPASPQEGGEFLNTDCDGTSDAGACDVGLKANQFAIADFRRAALVVNSTGISTDQNEADQGICDVTPTASRQTCTLPQAILTSNHLGGQPIGFDIAQGGGNTFDGTTPQIRDDKGDANPAVQAPAIIDGTSQPGGLVELSGTAADLAKAQVPTSGLQLSKATTVKGFVINGYSDDIEVGGSASGSTIQGDLFGTDVAGDAADPDPLGTNKLAGQLVDLIGISLASGGNQIGGPGAGQGNVVAVHWRRTQEQGDRWGQPAAGIFDPIGGNVIQGDTVGLVAGTLTALLDPKPDFAIDVIEPESALMVAGSDTVGGAAAGDGNVFSPESSISGASVVEGDEFHAELFAAGDVQVGGPAASPGTAAGNVFFPDLYGVGSQAELEMGGSGGVVQGNKFDPT
ncbi:MAG TPA: carboxypeptidase-like regulatory domain-containing protein, partial [Acidimicrobiales bacterium]|nr:carboxypeptidase-like regulatory domain-containing protein [Acidimicrobiales bacterium]